MSEAASNVLNKRDTKGQPGPQSCEVETPQNLSKNLQRIMLRLKAAHMADDGSSVDYHGMKGSPVFTEYQNLTHNLQNVDLDKLSENESKAFFINLYNALTVHGLVERDKLPESILDVQSFWKRTAYVVGPFIFSLDDIEHGILRGNKPHPTSTNNQFKDDDPRLKFVSKTFDPRIHFALVCGAKSCPTIRVFSAENLDTALDIAAKSFCEQEVKVYEMQRQLKLSQIFQWYRTDFGRDDVEAIRWTLPYLNSEKQKVVKKLLYLLEAEGMVDIKYQIYDWKLNLSPPTPSDSVLQAL